MKDREYYAQRLGSPDPAVRREAKLELEAAAKSLAPGYRGPLVKTRLGSSAVVRGAVRKDRPSGASIIAPTMSRRDLHAMRVDRRAAAQAEKLLELQSDDGVEGQSFCPTIRWS